MKLLFLLFTATLFSFPTLQFEIPLLNSPSFSSLRIPKPEIKEIALQKSNNNPPQKIKANEKKVIQKNNGKKFVKKIIPTKKRAKLETKKVSPLSKSKTHQKILTGPSKKKKFNWPLSRDKFWISCFFGTKERGRLHAGIDLAALQGTPVYAAASGIVKMACFAGSFGNMILIEHDATYKTRYAHLLKMVVSSGKHVREGELIGYVGKSGRTWGANGEHLHFEILENQKPVNPTQFL